MDTSFPNILLNSEILIKGQMRFDNAFCFGNGKSRLDFDMDVIKDKAPRLVAMQSIVTW